MRPTTSTPATTTSTPSTGSDKSGKGNKDKSNKPAATSKTDAPSGDAEPPSLVVSGQAAATSTSAAAAFETEESKRARLIEEQKTKIAERQAARKRKEEEDAKELELLSQGILPEKTTRAGSGSGVTAQHVLNQIGAGARSVHRCIAEIEASIIPENPATQSADKTAALGFLRNFRKERMDFWTSKRDERLAAGEEMKHVLPLDLTVDDRGNVTTIEKPKAPRKSRKGQDTAPATA